MKKKIFVLVMAVMMLAMMLPAVFRMTSVSR